MSALPAGFRHTHASNQNKEFTMRSIAVAAVILTAAVNTYAQGSVMFANRVSGATFNQTTHIWGPSSTDPSLSFIGLGSNDSPSGTTLFGAATGMSLIGASGRTGQFGYATTFAQLIGAVGMNQPESALVPVGQTTTFRTGSALGDVALITSFLPQEYADAHWATFEIVAWDNSSGQYPTWHDAYTAWIGGDIAAGHSAIFNVANIGGTANVAPSLTEGGGLDMTSFNLYLIPEPSALALAGLATTTLLLVRRRG
jgi:hypothetical protein